MMNDEMIHSMETHQAAISGDLNALELAVEQGADPFIVDQEQKTALHLAIEKNHHEIIQYLVDLNPERTVNTLADYNSYQESPLYCAAKIGNLEVIGYILDSISADTHRFQLRSLKAAIAYNQFEALKLLVERLGLTPEQLEKPSIGTDMTMGATRTLLFEALWCGRLEIVRFLLEEQYFYLNTSSMMIQYQDELGYSGASLELDRPSQYVREAKHNAMISEIPERDLDGTLAYVEKMELFIKLFEMKKYFRILEKLNKGEFDGVANIVVDRNGKTVLEALAQKLEAASSPVEKETLISLLEALAKQPRFNKYKLSKSGPILFPFHALPLSVQQRMCNEFEYQANSELSVITVLLQSMSDRNKVLPKGNLLAKYYDFTNKKTQEYLLTPIQAKELLVSELEYLANHIPSNYLRERFEKTIARFQNTPVLSHSDLFKKNTDKYQSMISEVQRLSLQQMGYAQAQTQFAYEPNAFNEPGSVWLKKDFIEEYKLKPVDLVSTPAIKRRGSV